MQPYESDRLGRIHRSIEAVRMAEHEARMNEPQAKHQARLNEHEEVLLNHEEERRLLRTQVLIAGDSERRARSSAKPARS